MTKKAKKILVIVLALTMLLSIAVGCSKKEGEAKETSKTQETEKTGKPDEKKGGNFNAEGMPIVNKEITLTATAKKRHDVPDFNTMAIFKLIHENTNIAVDWELVPDDAWKEKKNLVFASGDLPDVFFGNGTITDIELVKYGSAGLILPINDLIEQYGTHIKVIDTKVPGLLNKIVAPDGNIYALPKMSSLQPSAAAALFLNATWIEKLGLEIPVTTNDFADMLVAIKEAGDINENGKADELPFSYMHKKTDWVNGIGDMYGSFGRIDNPNHIVVEEGKVIFTAIQEEYKKATMYFSDLYAKGVIDKESFTQDGSVMHAKIKSDPMILGAANFWTKSWATGDANSERWVAIPPLVGPEGHQIWSKSDTSVADFSAICISSTCEIPEIAFRWADYMYSEEIGYQLYFGTEGDTIEKLDDGTYALIPWPEGMTQQEYTLQFTPQFNGIFSVAPVDMYKYYTKLAISPMEKNITLNRDIYSKYQTDNYFPRALFTADEAKKISMLKTDINSFVEEKSANWIINGDIEKEWDNFIDELNAIGLEDYLAVHQGIYDRYVGK